MNQCVLIFDEDSIWLLNNKLNNNTGNYFQQQDAKNVSDQLTSRNIWTFKRLSYWSDRSPLFCVSSGSINPDKMRQNASKKAHSCVNLKLKVVQEKIPNNLQQQENSKTTTKTATKQQIIKTRMKEIRVSVIVITHSDLSDLSTWKTCFC